MLTPFERRVVFLIAGVQFVNILDFMMVMPLGPDFGRALSIPEAHLGWIGGSYLAAAAVAGVVFTPLLDRFERRLALFVTMVGLFVGTVAAAFSWDFSSLIAARVLAGLFGGPATAVALACVGDAIPAERRGRAMGMVMGAFSLASVLGVPAGLELARLGGWRAPFWIVGVVGGVFAVLARVLLPEMRGHLRAGAKPRSLLTVLRLPGAWACALVVVGVGASTFSLVTNVAAFFQGNLGYPRETFGLLYLAGGAASFVTMRVAGIAVDRFGSFRVVSVASVSFAVVMIGCFALEVRAVPPMVWFMLFMVTSSTRNVSWNTLVTKVPPADARAGLTSALNAVQHAAASGGAFLGSLMLTTRPDGGLDGMPGLVAVGAALSLSVVPLVAWVEADVARRARA